MARTFKKFFNEAEKNAARQQLLSDYLKNRYNNPNQAVFTDEILLTAINQLKQNFEAILRMSDDVILKQGLELYIDPDTSSKIGGSERLDLLSVIFKFFLNTQQRSLLLLGDSGSGKTILLSYLVQLLWQCYSPRGLVPVLIHLPSVPKSARSNDLLNYFFKKQHLSLAEKKALSEQANLLIFLDGIDEIESPGNLFRNNKWGVNIKIISSCRTEAVIKQQCSSSYYENFLIGNSLTSFKELVIQPLSESQMDMYTRSE